MGQWIKYTVILIVLAGWIAYIATQVFRGGEIPLAIWSVPGATLALATAEKSPFSIIRSSPKKGEE